MQIFKRIKAQNRLIFRTSSRVLVNRRPAIDAGSQGLIKAKKSQNLIEFVFIMPILIFITLSIFEVALYWQDVNSIYSLNEAINANAALEDTKNMSMGTPCTAATKSLAILEARDSSISMNNPTYTKMIIDGTEPFALYEYDGGNQIADNLGESKPQITLWVDCRSPFEEGIITQLEFYHKTMVMKASIPRFDGKPAIVIIPDNIFISSPKLNTVRHY